MHRGINSLRQRCRGSEPYRQIADDRQTDSRERHDWGEHQIRRLEHWWDSHTRTGILRSIDERGSDRVTHIQSGSRSELTYEQPVPRGPVGPQRHAHRVRRPGERRHGKWSTTARIVTIHALKETAMRRREIVRITLNISRLQG